MGKFIYKKGTWKDFTTLIESKNMEPILHHLMMGLGVTWIGFGLTNDFNPSSNVIIWFMFSALDIYIRYKGMYSYIASLFNGVVVNLLFVWWFYEMKVNMYT
jgi:K+-sensing histidine kinase KdpD